MEVDPEANIIVGATYDPSIGDRIRVSIVALRHEPRGRSGARSACAGRGLGSRAPSAAARRKPRLQPAAAQAEHARRTELRRCCPRPRARRGEGGFIPDQRDHRGGA